MRIDEPPLVSVRCYAASGPASGIQFGSRFVSLQSDAAMDFQFSGRDIWLCVICVLVLLFPFSFFNFFKVGLTDLLITVP